MTAASCATRCALSIDWGDIGTLAIDPKTSVVQNKVGSIILPGTKQVVNRATGKLVACNKKTCPYAVNGVNHAPFAAFGGWSGAVNAAADDKVGEAGEKRGNLAQGRHRRHRAMDARRIPCHRAPGGRERQGAPYTGAP